MTRFNSRRTVMTLLVALGAAASLSGCFPLVAAGAAGGALVATDRRTSGTQLEDQGIEMRAGKVLRNSPVEPAHIDVTSYNRRVLLTGEVPNEQDKQLAEQLVSRVENVQAIVNELQVGENASLTQRSSDTLITGRVKASFVDARDLYANAFKVVTENGTVYLMGRVTQREAERATDIARSISGVRRVVRIFDIVGEADLLQQEVPQQPAK
ncbi:BON domain-containing protein [Polaromonas sp. C04]|uniref:BON domain-containing protein n=1 Tax=Polaromonas sp. C04 TaxID=1945857 RepID=UPI0009844128|nr:BON domain-containing protein [Polaromonas sp. C04]OOG50425.1 transporter [Polaromonas sp. C04]